jgi:hypothetical protein
LGSAYTPGLKISANTVVEKLRRLPLKGQVIVKVGDRVEPDTVVARTELPGILQTVKVAEHLGVEPQEVKSALLVKMGDQITKGMMLAQTKGLWGLFKTEYKSPVSGRLELISETTGHLGVRMPPIPVEKDAYIEGEVVEVVGDEGVVIRCRGAMVQGIFGVGGERQGRIVVLSNSPEEPLPMEKMTPELKGCIVVGGSRIPLDALQRAAEVGFVGLVAGGVVDKDLIGYLRAALNDQNFDIGVAITGQEPIPFSLMVTEGFGNIRMAQRTFDLFKSLEGRQASINGATQIRAGVIRPEVIVPLAPNAADEEVTESGGELTVGTSVRVIREPYFGILGTVTALPSELKQVDSETWVRVLQAKLEDGREVTVPRANVEIIVAG